jgi:prolycopene isomerase
MEEMLGLNEEVEKFFGEGKLNLARKIVFPLRFPRMWGARNKSLADYLYRYVSHPELRAVLSVFCEYYGLPPSKLSAFYYMNATGAFFKHGGSYPFGGSQAISNALVRVIEDRGGEVRLSTKVDRVLVSDGKVSGIRVSDGKVEKVPAVAANCSAVTLFGKMIERQHIPGEYLDKIQRLRPSISSFVVWLGLNKDITDKIRDSHIFLCSETDAEKAFQFGLEGEADRANLSVCIYSNIYKDYSPPGTTALSITLISGYDSWKPFEQDYWAGRKAQYRQKKQEIAEKLIRRVESDLVPGLSGMIEVREVATPLTNARFTLNTQGAIYGFEQSIDNSFMNRISNRTPIKGLYLAGAWGEPGGGYAGVLISGKRTFGMLMEEWGSD